MRKPVLMIFAVIILISSLCIPTALANGKVKIAVFGSQEVKPGETYDYKYEIAMTGAYSLQAKVSCNAAISGNLDPTILELGDLKNRDATITGTLSVTISEDANSGDKFTIVIKGGYNYIEEIFPCDTIDIEYSYPLTVAPPEPSPTPTSTLAPAPTPTKTPVPTHTPTPTPTKTPVPTHTPTPTPTKTPQPTPTRIPTPKPISTPQPTPTRTPTTQPTSTVAPTNTPTAMPTDTPTATPSQTIAPKSTTTPSPTPKPINLASPAVTTSPTPSSTPSATITAAISDVNSPSSSPTEAPAIWDALSTELDKLDQGGTINMTLTSADHVPAATLEAIKAKQATLNIDYGGYSCTIDGTKLGNIQKDSSAYQLAVSLEKDAAISDAANNQDIYQLHFAQDGEMPGRFTYRFAATANQPGDTLYLYCFHELSGLTEYKQSAIVDENGNVSFDIFEGLSYFVTASQTEEMKAEPGIALAAPFTDNADTGSGPNYWLIIAVVFAAAIIVVFGYMRIRHKGIFKKSYRFNE